MSNPTANQTSLPPDQQAIRNNCFHPSGIFVEFSKEEVGQSIPERFEKIVQRYPDRLAVKMGDCALTYDELNKAANRIARAIVDNRGSQPEPVVVLLEQGVPAIAAILGVLKAGKFYVPVIPSFPSARVAAILDDAEPGLLITDNKNVSVARQLTRNLLNIDEISTNLSDENLSLPVSPDDLAYIIYTSGTTGKPKGVFQNQRNVLQWTLVHSNAIHICAEDRLLLMHSHTTSGGTHRTWDALLNGAALFPFDFRADGVKFAKWLLDERITIYQSGPLVFRQWVDALGDSEGFPDLRLIRLSGMTINVEDVARYRRHFSPACILVHVLGTSEAGTIPHYFVDKWSKVRESRLPVGYATGDSKVSVVDENGRRAKPEAVGEIIVQSRYLACGYWRNAELTNEKFLPDPEGGEERLYLTGDLGRMSADGCLYHLGRKDFRVKIRGYSVELSEIEGALREHPAIKEVVVISAPDAKGEPQLIAYLVPVIEIELTASALRNYLNNRLPEYMVPSVFVTLATLPLTPSGKIDRKALPSPLHSRPGQYVPYVAPRTPLEQELKKIWSEVLCFDDIGVLDDFFDLGGHSLRAAQILSRIQKSSHIEISLEKLFAAPTIAALAEYIESAHPTSSGETFSVETIARDEPLPLSFAQERLWFLDQLEPGSVRYNVALALRFTGRLDAPILQRSLNEIVKRHESLRAVFTVVDGQPFQKILPIVTVELPVIDLREIVARANRSSALQQVIAEEAHRPFDLACGPLIRCKLLVLGREQYVVLLTLHHIAFDGWSGTILERELSALYAAFSKDMASPLPELPFQYADYAAWQARSLRGPLVAKLVSYWKKQLTNLSRLQLPTDRPRPVAQSCRGARKWFSLSAATTQALNALSRQEQATLFMVLLTALQTLLHRYTGQTDIVTGTPVAGRRHAETEKLIGFFLNMLVLRVDLSGNPTFREAVARTRQVCLDGYANEELPFEMLVEELKPERFLDQNPLFQVSFVLQNFPKAPFETADFKEVELDIDPGIARFDLHVFMTEEEGRLKGYFEYNIDLFETATIERMVAHFQTLLDGIAANPEQRISDLPLLSKTESHQLLIGWNDTEQNYPEDKCIHELFEEQAAKTPDAVAVLFEGQQLTYGELNIRANRLAHYLEKLGVGPEVLVAICMNRSMEMIVGLLGILKAGGAYVPLDPEYPEERLTFMLRDTQASVLVTEDTLLEKFVNARTQDGAICAIPAIQNPKSEIQNPTVVCLDSEWDEIAQESKENPSSGASPKNLAYVIYTSGSTGQPKGVMIFHAAIVNHMVWMQRRFNFGPADGFVQKTPISFDASVWELFAPLISGARLILARPQGHQDSGHLVRLIQASGATVLQVVPSMLRVLLEEQEFSKCVTLRLVFCGGETLTRDAEKEFFQRLTCPLNNLYGPTEATIDATHWECERNVDRSVIPIGRPIANTQIYVLDANLQPVPMGVLGEIYIGGAGVARGYLNQPELTAEKFITHCFDGEPARRLYRTGDRARYLADGNIEFLGRLDDQVKIRGYRIEPEEIEAVLTEHPAVRECVVIACERLSRNSDNPESRISNPRSKIQNLKSLVAYFVPRECAPASAELRGHLRARLPEYMVPAAFVVLDSLPLTTNGKVDRHRLSSVNPTPAQLDQSYVAPCTSVEEIIAGIWSEILGVERVGAHDNFFDLGGHSLLATQVISRVRRTFQVDVPLRLLFQMPTVAQMASAILAQRAAMSGGAAVADILTEVEEYSDAEAELGIAARRN